MRGCLIALAGFVGVLVVIAVLAIIAAIAVPNFLGATGFQGFHPESPFMVARPMYNLTELVTTVGFFGVCFLLIVFAMFAFLLKGTPKKESAARLDEDREMQELYRGFEDLGRRMESLETILLEHSEKR